jgi:uncharacterized membrane protein YesL
MTNGKLANVITLIYRFLALNVLFLVVCIGIVTIPPALAGLFVVARKIVQERGRASFFVDFERILYKARPSVVLFVLTRWSHWQIIAP